MGILEVLPQPKRLKLGNRWWVISELRIKDLAKIHQILVESFPLEVDSLLAKIANNEGREERKERLRLRLALENYPPTYPSALSELYFRTVKGGCLFFMLLLGRDNEIDVADAIDLVGTITEEERGALNDVLWGVSPLQKANQILSPAPISAKNDPPDWCRLFAEIAAKTGWTFTEISSLTIRQFNLAVRGSSGKREVANWTALSPTEMQEKYTEERELLAEIREEHGG